MYFAYAVFKELWGFFFTFVYNYIINVVLFHFRVQFYVNHAHLHLLCSDALNCIWHMVGT